MESISRPTNTTRDNSTVISRKFRKKSSKLRVESQTHLTINREHAKQTSNPSRFSIISTVIIVIVLINLLSQSGHRASLQIFAEAQNVIKLQDSISTSRSSPANSSHLADLAPSMTSNEIGDDESPANVRKLEPKASSMAEYLESLPTLSVGLKHSAVFECELDEESSKFKLIWLKLINRVEQSAGRLATEPPRKAGKSEENDVTLLSLNRRLITPDKRFKVRHQPPFRWILSIDNVGQTDDRAFYLCQASGATDEREQAQSAGEQSQPSGARFVGGGKLNVLVPPKIVEHETSPSLIVANEFEPLRLHCKVTGEPQSQISWRREDGKSLEGLEQRFRHQLERRPNQIISIDSSELLFDSVRREQSGAYLCIASNGILSGISQRINVAIEGCRSSPEPSSKPEPCEGPDQAELSEQTSTTSTMTPSSTTMTNNQHQLGRPGEQVRQMEASNSSQREPTKQPAMTQAGRRNNWKLTSTTTTTNGRPSIGQLNRRNSTDSRRRNNNNLAQ